MNVRYLTVPEALMIYAEVITASRVTSADVQNLPGLESALAQPKQTFDGKDLYPRIEQKAAALLYSLCQNHPFTDGNKRVAFIAANVFLRRNGFDLDVEVNDAIEFMYSVARGELSVEMVAAWIAARLCPFERTIGS
jgi:death-on-curing protein